jgi:hypothetical protein
MWWQGGSITMMDKACQGLGLFFFYGPLLVRNGKIEYYILFFILNYIFLGDEHS